MLGNEKLTGSVTNVFDEEHLDNVQEIRREIATVEAERKRLMDAFSGLELTSLTKGYGQVSAAIESRTRGDDADATWRSQRFASDSDALSTRSGTSVGTTLSISRSAYSSRRARPMKSGSPIISRPGSLHRKNSTSSVTSQGKIIGSTLPIPPVPALPSSLGLFNVGNNSSISLARSHIPLSSLAEDDGAENEGNAATDEQNETADIRKRREEVGARYDARLEYLQAKLKGAELHEKLMRK